MKNFLSLLLPFIALILFTPSAYAACEADFEWNQIDGTTNVEFFNTSFSDDDIISFHWNFGDGHEGDGQNPIHEYNEPGEYLVCLIITNSEGCVSDVCHEIVIESIDPGDCLAAFTWEQAPGDLLVHFYNQSTSDNDIISYLWNFGDGHNGDGQNPNHYYNAPGTYLVCLTITDNTGCMSDVCHEVVVEPGECNADFNWEQLSNSLQIHFHSTSTGEQGIDSYFWNFGDGHNGDGSNPYHTYNAPGTYVVCLTIETEIGCVDSICYEVVVEPLGSDCEADFEWNQIDDTYNVQFFNTSTSDHDIISFHWNFGDGHEGDGQNPIHEYDEPGEYLVCLIITNSEGCVSDVCYEIVIEGIQSDCEANFEWNQIDDTYNVQFFNTSTSDHDIISFHWNFGDGHEGDGQNPIHEYNEPGEYLVCLIITNSEGCVSDVCYEIVIEGIQGDCHASFEWEQIPGTLNIHFINHSTSDHDIISYLWIFGDGHQGDGHSPTHEYDEPGTYLVCLIITDNTGCISEVCHEVVVEPLDPGDCNADFNWENGGDSFQIHFQSTSTGDQGIDSYFWDFGDGHFGDGPSPYHTYNEPGTYVVCLTIETEIGCVDSICYEVVVELLGNDCDASFEWEQIPGTFNIHFINLSTSDQDIISYLWIFGDGHQGDGHSPTHEFDGPGEYTVCLIIETEGGCVSEECQQVIVEEIPEGCHALFEWEQIEGTLNIHFINHSFSDHDIISYHWTFGDGHEGDGQNPTHEYDEPGTYLVCLRIEDNTGCVSEVCHEVVIGGESDCHAQFNWEHGGDSLQIHFHSTSTGDQGIDSYFWSFGDGHFGDGSNPYHTYDEPGTYLVCLTIETEIGCVDSICHEVVVEPLGTDCEASFEWEQIDGTFNIHFINHSTSDHDIISYLWIFGDGHQGDGHSPTHEYDEPGTYLVCLIITDNTGCVSEICHEVTVGNEEGCHASFTWDFIPGTLGVHFYDHSTSNHDIISYLWTFGDGHSSTEQNPTHEYDEPGGYLVCLRIEDNTGCVSEICHDFYLHGPEECEAHFNFEVDNDDVVHFNNTSTGATDHTTWFWDFGDGETSTEEDPIHDYEEPDFYTICLTMTDTTTGCVDEFCQSMILGLSWEDFKAGDVLNDFQSTVVAAGAHSEDFILHRYTNPVSDNLFIDYEIKKESTIRFEVYDLTGNRIVERNILSQTTGQWQEAIDIGFIHPGLYILVVSTGESQNVMRVSISR